MNIKQTRCVDQSQLPYEAMRSYPYLRGVRDCGTGHADQIARGAMLFLPLLLYEFTLYK